VASETIKWTRIAENTDLADLIRIINRRMSGLEVGGEEECPDYCGNGSPEGVITAVIGSEYMQWDAASTTHPRWVKFSNNGNTGWRQWEGLRGGAGANTALRLGDNSTATGTDSIAIGENAAASATRAIALGKTATAAGADSIAIGDADAGSAKQITIGSGNTWDAPDTPSAGLGKLAIGYGNSVEDYGSETAPGEFAVVIGHYNELFVADSGGSPPVVIGFNNTVRGGGGTVVIGSGATMEEGVSIAPGTFGVMIGEDTFAIADCFVALGYRAHAYGVGGHALGTHTEAGVDEDSVNCTAVGRFAAATGDHTVSLGSDSIADEESAIAIGVGAEVTATEAIALGRNATNAVANTMVIGSASEPIDTITVITSGGTKTVTLV
jgi:hypothetical protein